MSLESARVALQAGRALEARRRAASAHIATPDRPEALLLLGAALAHGGEPEAAMVAFQRAAWLAPDHPAAHYNLANLHLAAGRLAAAVDALGEVIARTDEHGLARLKRGVLLHRMGRLDEALPDLHRAARLLPQDPAAHGALAVACVALGDSAAAVRRLRAALLLAPENATLFSDLLMTLHYVEEQTRADLARLHRLWGGVHAPTSRARSAVAPRAGNAAEHTLTVGFVSANFRSHAVGFFLPPLLAARPSGAWRAVLYADNVAADDRTALLRGLADEWRDIGDLDDAAAADAIRADGVDILFDLHGHTAHHRLSLFAGRAAPIQASWLDYVDTTGVRAIDYLVADRHHVPPGEDHYYLEQIVRLPDDYICYQPPARLPEIAQAPCASSGRFVFGCFNNLCKVTPAVIQIWAALLARVPHARLLLNSWELRQAAARDRYAGLLREAGIAAGRVDLHPGGGHFYFLDQYNLIDVALDPFPYSGGLSTCEALMMGVPVVTFPGERFCGRHATSHLTNAGLASWVAPDLDGYVDLAVGLARDPGAVVEARAALRDRTLRSRLCDAGAHARAFTRALTQMCGPNPPGAP